MQQATASSSVIHHSLRTDEFELLAVDEASPPPMKFGGAFSDMMKATPAHAFGPGEAGIMVILVGDDEGGTPAGRPECDTFQVSCAAYQCGQAGSMRLRSGSRRATALRAQHTSLRPRGSVAPAPPNRNAPQSRGRAVYKRDVRFTLTNSPSTRTARRHHIASSAMRHSEVRVPTAGARIQQRP